MRKSNYLNNRLFLQFSLQVMLRDNSRLTVDQKIKALKLLDGGSSERDVANRFSSGKGNINRIM